MISFCTEKTTEFSLVPEFSKILDQLGENAPIQFWKTREGNKTSSYLHGSESVYLLAFFARRPKVKSSSSNLFQGKINDSVFEFNSLAKEFGIPVFCGFPLAHNVFELNSSEKLWFSIPYDAPSDYEVIFNVTDTGCVQKSDPLDIIKPIDEADIVDTVKNNCLPMPWCEAVDIMTNLHRKPGQGFWFTRNWQYKPVYFVVKSKP